MQNKQRVTSKLWTFALGLAVLIGFGGNVYASTPDGETPANEGVCDVLQGGTPGLYGLCVAYCEAQDLDMLEDQNPPSTNILANYRKKMRAGDPDMPCLQAPCPCWSAAQLANIGSSGDLPACLGTSATSTVTQIRVTTPTVNQLASVHTGRNTCTFIDSLASPTIAISFSITPEEAQICRNQILSACTTFGQ